MYFTPHIDINNTTLFFRFDFDWTTNEATDWLMKLKTEKSRIQSNRDEIF